MTPLSPAAQAVLDEVLYKMCAGESESYAQMIAAAALRAAADQVVPVTPKPNDTFCCPPVDSIVWRRVAEIRAEFLAIAAELNGTTPH